MDKEALLHTRAGKQWEKIGLKEHHGINLPLFSLHSQNSCGIGEYPDLIPLIDWCKENHLDVIQLLPLNDNGPDSSPYNAISAFALNPLFIGITSLPYLSEYPDLLDQIPAMQQLTKSQRIDYAAVSSAKESFLRQYFLHVAPRIIPSDSYFQFVASNEWLKGYAQFKILKNITHWTPWEEWDTESMDWSSYQDELEYYFFLQYLCFEQMAQVKKYAESNGILLKGDIPILISRESADVWTHRDLFLLEYSVGSTPDAYAVEGQNWGFPPYNWKKLEEQDYKWWRQRLAYASHFYHLYRLDHIVGFFRIWAIQNGKSAKEGGYIPQDQGEWIPLGKKILEMMLDSNEMLPIGEDLGTIPPEVRACMAELGIPGTKVIRWERFWHQPGQPFIPYAQYPLGSMTTVSTHDIENLPLWWRNFPNDAKEFAAFKGWEYAPELSQEQNRELLRDSHESGSLFHINLLSEYFILVPGMTWPNLEDERINLPGVISDRNWTYRFRPSVEEIGATLFAEKALYENHAV